MASKKVSTKKIASAVKRGYIDRANNPVAASPKKFVPVIEREPRCPPFRASGREGFYSERAKNTAPDGKFEDKINLEEFERNLEDQDKVSAIKNRIDDIRGGETIINTEFDKICERADKVEDAVEEFVDEKRAAILEAEFSLAVQEVLKARRRLATVREELLNAYRRIKASPSLGEDAVLKEAFSEALFPDVKRVVIGQ